MVQPPETGGRSATSSLSAKMASGAAYSQFRASRTLGRCAASAGKRCNSSVQSCGVFSGDAAASSTALQPVASLSWAKNKTRMALRFCSNFNQQFSAGKNQHARQHPAEGDAAPAPCAEVRAEQRADDGGQREPEQRPGVRDFFPARAGKSGNGIEHDESRRDAACGFRFHPTKQIEQWTQKNSAAD